MSMFIRSLFVFVALSLATPAGAEWVYHAAAISPTGQAGSWWKWRENGQFDGWWYWNFNDEPNSMRNSGKRYPVVETLVPLPPLPTSHAVAACASQPKVPPLELSPCGTKAESRHGVAEHVARRDQQFADIVRAAAQQQCFPTDCYAATSLYGASCGQAGYFGGGYGLGSRDFAGYENGYFNTAQGNTLYGFYTPNYHSFANPQFNALATTQALIELSRSLGETATYTANQSGVAIKALADAEATKQRMSVLQLLGTAIDRNGIVITIGQPPCKTATASETPTAKVEPPKVDAPKVELPKLDSPTPGPKEPSGAGSRGIVQAKCVKCHGGPDAAAGLDLSDLTVLSPGQERKVLGRIVEKDPEKRMPKGGTLSANEIFILFDELYCKKAKQ